MREGRKGGKEGGREGGKGGREEREDVGEMEEGKGEKDEGGEEKQKKEPVTHHKYKLVTDTCNLLLHLWHANAQRLPFWMSTTTCSPHNILKVKEVLENAGEQNHASGSRQPEKWSEGE